jgi:hypothetical protein
MSLIKNITMRHCSDRIIAIVDFEKQGVNGTTHAVFEQKYAQYYGDSAMHAQNAMMNEIKEFAESKS